MVMLREVSDFPLINIYFKWMISRERISNELPSPAPNPAAAPPGTAPARPVAACAHGRFPKYITKFSFLLAIQL
jgi:hypothetical protein